MSKLILQIKRIIMFLLSPFIALGYMAAIPVVGIGVLLSSRKNASAPPGESASGC